MPKDAADRSARRELAATAAWRRWIAALVHLFTALGSCCALLAMLAVLDGALERAFAWLLVALVIDGIDGAFARAANVEVNVPRFSGERLDLVVDYLTYVFVPVLILLKSGILAGRAGLGLAALILLSSLYHFSDTQSKADDHSFVGFPAVWNLVAFCFLCWGLNGAWAGAIVLALVVLTFVPLRWLHPMRVERLYAVNISITAAALMAAGAILWSGFPATPVPGGIVALAVLYYAGLTLARSLANAKET